MYRFFTRLVPDNKAIVSVSPVLWLAHSSGNALDRYRVNVGMDVMLDCICADYTYYKVNG